MLLRSLFVWLGILVLAIANGALRAGVIIPLTGEAAGHVISCITLSVAALVVAWLAMGWMAPASLADAWRIGALWLALTLAFEFLAGHYLFNTPWSQLLADYNVFRGRLWVLVLLTTALAPYLVARARLGS